MRMAGFGPPLSFLRGFLLSNPTPYSSTGDGVFNASVSPPP